MCRRTEHSRISIADPDTASAMPTPVKFLLVDDLEENLLALEAILARDGLELHRARSGVEALELLLKHDFALALIDVHMPGMDGFELAELMRGTERCKHVPIIFATAGPREQRRLFEGYDAGAVDFLFKPIEPQILRHKAQVFCELHRQRQQLAAEAQERERLLAEVTNTLRLNEMFSAVLGHDLRTPLGAVLSGAAILEQDSSEETRAVARRIASSGQRMARLIDQLLDLTRARLAGGIPIDPRPTDLSLTIRRVVAELAECEGRPEVLVEIVGDAYGEWDEDRLTQVLSNLLTNAVSHGQRGAPIRVSLEGQSPDTVHLAVENEGHIDPALIAGLFDPFRQPDGSRKRRGGLGLGLYIVDQIVRAHGGRVEVRSTPSIGTCFRCSLPRRGAPAAPALPQAERAR